MLHSPMLRPVLNPVAHALKMQWLHSGGIAADPVAALIAMVSMGDSLTAARYYDTTQRNGGTASVHNWAIARYGQPWDYAGSYGVSGETTVQMLARMAPYLASIQAAVASGRRVYASIWAATNDVGTLQDSVDVVAARVQSIASQSQDAGARPIIWKLAGSEVSSSTIAQKCVDLNAAMQDWVASHAFDALKPLWCPLADSMWYRAPDFTMTPTNVCLAQTPAAGVGMTINGDLASGDVATFAQATKLLLTHSEGTARTVTFTGTDANGNAISEDVNLVNGVALKSSTKLFKTVTGASSAVAFTNPLTVGGCIINHKEGYPSDGLHPNTFGAYMLAPVLYATVIADAIPIAVSRLGVNRLVNYPPTAMTGGTVGTNTTAPNGMPSSWRSGVSSTVRVNSAALSWNADGSVGVVATTTAAVNDNVFLRQDPAVGQFTPGSVWEPWAVADVPGGNAAPTLMAISAELALTYATAGVQSFYADRAATVNLSVIPTDTPQTLVLRFPRITILAGDTVTAANYFARVHLQGSGVSSLTLRSLGLHQVS